MEKFKVLIVDDEVDILEVYKLNFQLNDYENICFSEVDDAVDYLEKNSKSIVLILSDFKIGDVNGFEFKSIVNVKNYDIPFVIISGFYTKEMAMKGMEYGISNFIEKPVVDYDLPPNVIDLVNKRVGAIKDEIEMIISFINESSPMLEEIEDLILSLENDPKNDDCLKTYYRLLHTIKGTASCVGLIEIPSFVHEYESFIGKVKNGELAVNSVVIGVLLNALDSLKLLYENTKNGYITLDIEERKNIFNLDVSNVVTINKSGVEEESVNATKASTETESKKENKIMVDMGILDSYMELSGELTVLRNTILKAANNLGDKHKGDRDVLILSDAIQEMHKVSSELQSSITEMRKIQVEALFRPLKRVVRDSGTALNKTINFKTNGDEIKVDTAIGKVISNSLVHMIRNSIDHGIETPEKRKQVGKKAAGEILLSIREEGDFIIINLNDDGNGLDIERIKNKAIEKQLYKKEQLDHFSEQKIFSLIFESGFSTAQKVSDISAEVSGWTW